VRFYRDQGSLSNFAMWKMSATKMLPFASTVMPRGTENPPVITVPPHGVWTVTLLSHL
jgi:hypothetical protein